MLFEIIERIVNHFEAAIETVEKPSISIINPPLTREDDEAEMMPLFEDDYDEIPF